MHPKYSDIKKDSERNKEVRSEEIRTAFRQAVREKSQTNVWQLVWFCLFMLGSGLVAGLTVHLLSH